MKRKIIAAFVSLSLLICSGCSTSPEKGKVSPGNPAGKGQTGQVVLAMNPCIVSSDGAVESARNVISKSMSQDVKSNTLSLYENTGWQWAYKSGELEYIGRSLRSLEGFKDCKGNTTKNAPYAYTVTDDGVSSLSVYDTSKFKVKGYQSDVDSKGVLFSLGGDKQEALIYTVASADTYMLCDTSGGSISLVSGVDSLNTDSLSGDKPAGVVLGVYCNNRLLWQELLGNSALLGEEKTLVAFPSVSGMEMSENDSFVITAKAVDSADGIETGYFDMPGGTSVIKKPLKVTREEEVQSEPNNAAAGVPLINSSGVSNFAIVCSKDAGIDVTAKANKIRTAIEDATGAAVVFKRDDADIVSEYKIFVGDTVLKESKALISELKNKRANNAADFAIRFYGRNLVIAAVTDYGLQLACDYFRNTYCKDSASVIPENLNYVSSEHGKMKNISIAGNNITKYKIVRSHTASYLETMAIQELVNLVAKTTGYQISVVTDYEAPSPYEIVIGTTNRTASGYYTSATTTALRNYSIKVQNAKLYVTADQTYGAVAGINELISKMKDGYAFPANFSSSGSYDGSYSLTNGYKLVWADEFNDNKLSKTWRQTVDERVNNFGNTIHAIPQNTYVENGAMVQRIVSDGSGETFGGAVDTISQNALWFQYGYCEYRVMLPKLPETIHAFWASGRNQHVDDFFLEIDLVETSGDNYSNHHTLHRFHLGDPSKHLQWGWERMYNYKYGTTQKELYGLEYHTFGFEWDTDTITFTCDGKVTAEKDISAADFEFMDNPVFIRMNTGFFENDCKIDLSKAGPLEDAAYIDYVRVYQKSDNGSKLSSTHLK